MRSYIPVILAAVIANAVSHLLLKNGMTQIGYFDFGALAVLRALRSVLFNSSVIVGFFMLVVSMALYLMVLSRVAIGFAFPFLSLSYVIVLVSGHYWFGEQLSGSRVFGVGLICAGTLSIARS